MKIFLTHFIIASLTISSSCKKSPSPNLKHSEIVYSAWCNDCTVTFRDSTGKMNTITNFDVTKIKSLKWRFYVPKDFNAYIKMTRNHPNTSNLVWIFEVVNDSLQERVFKQELDLEKSAEASYIVP